MTQPMSGPQVAAGRDRILMAAVGGFLATWGGFWSLLIWDTGGKTPILWCVVVSAVAILVGMSLMASEASAAPKPVASTDPARLPATGTSRHCRLDRAHPTYLWSRRPHKRIRPNDG
jgi:hypothetical protein